MGFHPAREFEATIAVRLNLTFEALHPPLEPELPPHPGEPPAHPKPRRGESEDAWNERVTAHAAALLAHQALLDEHPKIVRELREAHAETVSEARRAAARYAESELAEIRAAFAKLLGVEVVELVVEEVRER